MDSHPIFVNYYNPKMLLGKEIVCDILKELIDTNKKVLVFGLGYDSKMWYNANKQKNIWFIESNNEYIKLNNYIDPQYLIKYDYRNITVKTSFKLSDNEINDIKKYPLPPEVMKHAPYDLIIVDAPTGFNDAQPGRLLPIYWTANKLSRKGTVIYVDDVERPLENYCINKFLSGSIFVKQFMNMISGKYCYTDKLIKN